MAGCDAYRKGRGLQTVLVALAQWADEYLLTPDRPPPWPIDNLTRQPLHQTGAASRPPMAGRSDPMTSTGQTTLQIGLILIIILF